MNINISRSQLLPTLLLTSSVVEKRQTLPILANLFLAMDQSRLTVIGTDMEVEISQTITEVSGDDGQITVSTRKLLDICRTLPEDAMINLSLDKNGNMIVKSGRSRYTLNTISSEDFPRISTENWEERLQVKENALKSLIDKTAFAMAIQDVRFYLNGILLDITNGVLRSTATDGHRLSQSEINIDLKTQDSRQLIIPRKAVLEIQRFLDDSSEEDVTIEVTKKHFKLSKGNTVLITKLIDGKFPEFSAVLESTLPISLTINKAQLTDALVRVAVLTTDRFKGVRLQLQDNLLTLSSSNPDHEQGHEEIEVEYQGDSVESGFNVGYLIDAAKIVKSNDVIINLQSNDGICTFKQPDDDFSTWLIMPMRI